MNKDNVVNEDIFECKLYITDLETNKNSKEINITDLIFDDNLEFEFGNYEDDDYGQLPYKDFKFFINDYSVTFYSPQYHKAIKEIDRLNNIINEYENKGYDIAQERADFLLEIQRLNNIINELEKYINKTKLEEFEKVYEKRYGKTFTQAEVVICNMILDKLKELKEGNNVKDN